MADVPIDLAEIQSARLVLGSAAPATPPSGHGQLWGDASGLLQLLRPSGNAAPSGFAVLVASVVIPTAETVSQDVVVDLASGLLWNTEDVTVSGTNLVIGSDGLYLKVLQMNPNTNDNTLEEASISFPQLPDDFRGIGQVHIGKFTVPAHATFVDVSPSYAGDVCKLTIHNPYPQAGLVLSPLMLSVHRVGSLPPGW